MFWKKKPIETKSKEKTDQDRLVELIFERIKTVGLNDKNTSFPDDAYCCMIWEHDNIRVHLSFIEISFLASLYMNGKEISLDPNYKSKLGDLLEPLYDAECSRRIDARRQKDKDQISALIAQLENNNGV